MKKILFAFLILGFMQGGYSFAGAKDKKDKLCPSGLKIFNKNYP